MKERLCQQLTKTTEQLSLKKLTTNNSYILNDWIPFLQSYNTIIKLKQVD